ncbi:MAG: RNA 2',3'-cyclic phosphodiesterase [Eubacteriales bacterium]|nr:RNA 2',3'-cyclic phosphodiesterase [Eubacteriales bacterium]
MRLFIRIGIPPRVQTALYETVERLAAVTPGRFVPPERYHITLAFLGRRDEVALPPLRAILRETASIRPGFPITVDGFGRFDEKAIIYAAISPNEALVSLGDALRNRLSDAGEPYDLQPFTPHVTLARKASLPLCAPLLSPVSFMAESLTLYHSTRIDGILHYVPIFEVPFAALFVPDTARLL